MQTAHPCQIYYIIQAYHSFLETRIPEFQDKLDIVQLGFNMYTKDLLKFLHKLDIVQLGFNMYTKDLLKFLQTLWNTCKLSFQCFSPQRKFKFPTNAHERLFHIEL